MLRTHKPTAKPHKGVKKSAHNNKHRAKHSNDNPFARSALSLTPHYNNTAKFSTETTPQNGENAEAPADGQEKKKEKKEKKAPRTWLQIYAEMQLRQLSGPLPTKVSKNDQRIKARNDHMKDFVQGGALVEKLLNLTPTTQVWCRPWAEKQPPECITLAEAQQKAIDAGLQLAAIRSTTQNPEKPPNMATVFDDNIVPVWLMDTRAFMEDLYQQDTAFVKGGGVKDVSINTTITPDDLQRKLQQCFEFLFEGNTVKLSCQSKAVRSVQDFVERNTHLDSEAIQTQADEAIERGKTLDMDQFLGKTKASKGVGPRAQSIAARAHPGEMTDQDRKAKLKQVDARINQHITRVSGMIKKMQDTIKQSEQKYLDHNMTAQKDPKHRDHKHCKVLKRGQFLPSQKEFLDKMQLDLKPLQDQLEGWRKKSAQVKQGVMVVLGGGGGGGAGGAGGAGGDHSDGEAGDWDDGGDDGDGGDSGAVPGVVDDDAPKEKSQKMSKREMEEHKSRMAMNKMSAKEKVQYLAGLQASQTYPIMADVVETIGKLSCIIMQERAIRKKSGDTLSHEEMGADRLAKLSNKDRKRYEQRLEALKNDPHSELRLELDNALKLIQTKYIYNDAILEQQTKKPFWVTHNAPSLTIAAQTKQLTMALTKSADGKK